MSTTMETPMVHVRPAWGAGVELSERARTLLIREWIELGLLDADADKLDSEVVLQGVQRRDATVTDIATRRDTKLVTTAGDGPPGKAASSASFEGIVLSYGEQALIGVDTGGRPVRERFLPGSVRMPTSGAPVLFNRSHDKSKVIGHVTGVSDVDDQVRVRGVVADRTTDGYDALELAALGSVTALSIEFLPVSPSITRGANGEQMHEHRQVLLVGLALVPAGAYPSARLLRLLGRVEAGRDREQSRRAAIARLDKLKA